jgi:hypothetical protein
LLENGNPAPLAAGMDRYRVEELKLAEAVMPALSKGMLCLAGRYFSRHNRWREGGGKYWPRPTWENPEQLHSASTAAPAGRLLPQLNLPVDSEQTPREQLHGGAGNPFPSGHSAWRRSGFRLITTVFDHTHAPAEE